MNTIPHPDAITNNDLKVEQVHRELSLLLGDKYTFEKRERVWHGNSSYVMKHADREGYEITMHATPENKLHIDGYCQFPVGNDIYNFWRERPAPNGVNITLSKDAARIANEFITRFKLQYDSYWEQCFAQVLVRRAQLDAHNARYATILAELRKREEDGKISVHASEYAAHRHKISFTRGEYGNGLHLTTAEITVNSNNSTITLHNVSDEEIMRIVEALD